MAAAAMKHIALNFATLDKFEGVDIRRWQKKMHFLLSSMSVVYVLTTPIPKDGENATMEQIRKKNKWDNDDYDASSKKFLVSNFTNYKMTDSRPVMEQYNELLGILGRFTQHKMNIDEAIQEELTLVEFGSHLCIKESLRTQDNDKPNDNNVVGPSVVNMMEHNKSFMYNDNEGKRKHQDTKSDPNKKSKVTCWKCRKYGHLKKDCKSGKVGNKANGSSTNGSSNSLKDDDVAWWVDSGAIVHVCKDRCCMLHWAMSTLSGSSSFKRLIPDFAMDTEKCKTCMLTKITKKPFQNVKRETEVLELIHSDLCDLQATPSLGKKKYFVTYIDDAFRVPNKRNRITPYELWTKRKPNQNYLRVWGCKEVVRLPDPKLKTLGERGIECIFVGYVEHSKAFRFYVIKPNESVSINLIIESKDAIFDENRFSSVPRPSQRSMINGNEDIGVSVVPKKVTKEVVVQQPKPELRKSKRNRTPKNFVLEFQLYLIEGTREEVSDQHSYCFNIEDDPKTFDEAMKSQDGFKQKSRIDYVDTYALVARISTIRLLIALASIHNLIIHQMDVKAAFLNGELDEEVYMNQPQGFIVLANENKVCKLIKSLYGLKQAPKKWHQKFDEVVLSSGYLLNQADKCVYSKFDKSGKGVIICLYVDDMLIFGIDQVQSYYIEKILKKFSYFDCTLVSTPMDTNEKLMPNNVGKLSRYTDASWISNTEDNSSEVGKETEWLRNLILEMPLRSKPIAPISTHCDSAATLAKAYSQMYNGKSRHLGVRHSMIR
ncbi:zinc finger, CCHC-type containing protein [Tanacetum coccineum]